MTNVPVACALVTAFNNKHSFVWQEKMGGFHSDWHEHPKGQFMYAENGCIHLNVEGKSLLLPTWYGAWIPSRVSHYVWSDSPDVFIRTIYFGIVEDDFAFDQVCVFPVSNLYKEMLRYAERWHKKEPTREEEVFLEAMKGLLIGEMAKAAHVCLPSTTHPKLSIILNKLNNNLQKRWGLEFVAKEFGLSPRTLTRLFSNHLNISFSKYCKISRIMKALELIENGADNVSEITSFVGYESISTFSNNFLEICGNRPIYFIHNKKNIKKQKG